MDPVTLQTSSTSGFGPLSVTFQATATVPGQILEVRYDFDGDGIVDLVAYNLNPVTHLYSNVGDFFPVVTVVTTAGSFSSVGGFFAQGPGARRIHIQAPLQQESLTSIANPVDVKWTSNGSLYVLSRSAAKVIQFAADGTTVRSITGIGLNPSGFDIDSAGQVYVALTGNNQVARLKPDGNTFVLDALFNGTGKIGRPDGAAGAAAGEFNQPYDVAVTPDGQEIYVTDSGNHRLQKFSTSGQYRSTIGEFGNQFGQFNIPKGLTFDKSGVLWVADSGNSRLALVDFGGVVEIIGGLGNSLGEFLNPSNLGADFWGVYVADTGNNRIQMFNSISSGYDGRPDHNPVWATPIDLGLTQPESVYGASTLVDHRITIADTGNNRILSYTLPEPTAETAWNLMKQRLAAGDIEGALAYFASESVPKFRESFVSLGAADLAEMAGNMGAITAIQIDSDIAQYRFDQVVDDIEITFLVGFIKENGQWRIAEF